MSKIMNSLQSNTEYLSSDSHCQEHTFEQSSMDRFRRYPENSSLKCPMFIELCANFNTAKPKHRNRRYVFRNKNSDKQTNPILTSETGENDQEKELRRKLLVIQKQMLQLEEKLMLEKMWLWKERETADQCFKLRFHQTYPISTTSFSNQRSSSQYNRLVSCQGPRNWSEALAYQRQLEELESQCTSELQQIHKLMSTLHEITRKNASLLSKSNENEVPIPLSRIVKTERNICYQSIAFGKCVTGNFIQSFKRVTPVRYSRSTLEQSLAFLNEVQNEISTATNKSVNSIETDEDSTEAESSLESNEEFGDCDDGEINFSLDERYFL